MSDQLLMADRMKELYLTTGERKYLDEYWRFRLWAPVESGYVNLTECAMDYIRANCVNATVGGLKIRDRAALKPSSLVRVLSQNIELVPEPRRIG